MPWTVPTGLPGPSELRGILARCEQIIQGNVTPAFAKQCLAKMLVAFEPNTKLSGDDMRLRAMVWLEACGDLNDGLWAEATAEAIRTLKWMPKPAEFRGLVDARIEEARKAADRLRRMLDAQASIQAKPFVPEPREVRMRALRDSFKRVGMIGKAARYERDIAREEKREPADWARGDIPEAREEKAERPPFVPSQSPSAIRCAELAKERRTAAGDGGKDRAHSAGTPTRV